MKSKLIHSLAAILAIVLGLQINLPHASAAITGCPDTWNLTVSLKNGVAQPTPRYIENDDAFLNAYEETSGQLATATKSLGANIATTFIEEFSQDGTNWIDINNYPHINDGYFSNSFKIAQNQFVNFPSMFRYFNAGKVRISLKVETKDCPANPGLFYSRPQSLPKNTIYEDKTYDLASLLPATVNFKDAAALVQNVKNWVTTMSSALSTRGISSGWDDSPPVDGVVVVSAGSPPCVNYVNRGWAATASDCSLLVFYTSNDKVLGRIYYLIDTVVVSSPLKASAVKAAAEKAAAELKAKQEAEAKAAADKSANLAIEAMQAKLNSLIDQLNALNAKMAANEKSLNAANAKLKIICAAKPKPKGC
jgi:flagellin-like hook-associated protein FlgL